MISDKILGHSIRVILTVGVMILTGAENIRAAEPSLQENIISVQDFSFITFNWQITGKWNKRVEIFEIDCTAFGTTDAALSLTFPQMGRDDIKRFSLSAENKTYHFTYKPPFKENGNPYNRYRIKIKLESKLGTHTETTELIGKYAPLVGIDDPRASSKTEKSIIGVNVHFSFAPRNIGSFAGWHKYRKLTDMIADAGIKWIRDSVGTEKSDDGKLRVKPFVLDWMHYAKKKNINIIALIDMSSNETEEQFIERCRTIAEAMKGITDIFELGNEPQNFGDWRKKYGGTWNGKEKDNSTSEWVKAHLKYTNAGANAIKEVRPNAVCIGLGACPPTNFRAITLGLSKYVDGVVDHPYSFSMPPERVPYSWRNEKRDGILTGDKNGSFVGLMLSYINIFKNTGQMRSLWLTEFGWSTFWFNGDNEKEMYAGFTENSQAIYLIRRFIQCMAIPAIKVACQYDFLDDYSSNKFNPEANFGLLRSDYSPKPSYYAIRHINSLFAGYEYDNKVIVNVKKAPLHRSMKRNILINNWDGAAINADNDICAYGFSNPEFTDRRMLAVWSKLPVSDEFNNRTVSIRISGWKNFCKYPLAVDIITETSFDVPIKIDGNDLIIDLLITDNPVVVKLFSSN